MFSRQEAVGLTLDAEHGRRVELPDQGYPTTGQPAGHEIPERVRDENDEEAEGFDRRSEPVSHRSLLSGLY